MNVKNPGFRVGQLVCFSRAFLGRMSWFSGVPRRGKVASIQHDKKGYCYWVAFESSDSIYDLHIWVRDDAIIPWAYRSLQ